MCGALTARSPDITYKRGRCLGHDNTVSAALHTVSAALRTFPDLDDKTKR